MSRFPHVRPEPGFDLYAPIVPQSRRGCRLAWVGIALVLAIVAAVAVVSFRHLDRPAVSEMRGTIHASWVPAPTARERDLASLEVGDRR